MYDDAEFLRFGIDPQRRAAFQTFVTETCKRLEADPDLRDDCEMEMWAKLISDCASDPSQDDAYLKVSALNAARSFLRRERGYRGMFGEYATVAD